MQLNWSIGGPAWPALLLAAVAAVLWIRRHYRLTEPAPPPGARAVLTLLRSAAVLAALAGVAGPALVRESAAERRSEVVLLAEDSASMAIADRSGGPSRWERASELAAVADSLLRNSGSGAGVEPLRGNGIAATTGWSVSGGAGPSGQGTDLIALVDGVGGRRSSGELRGLILFSDGNRTAGLDAGAEPGLPAGARVLVVGLGDSEGPPDRFVQDLRYPEMIHAGDEAVVEIVAGRRGAASDSIFTVTLSRDGVRVAEAEAVMAPGDAQTRVELRVRPREPGLGIYELEIQPLPEERYRANNRATLALAVSKSRSDLLILAGRPGWDARFLAQAAAAGGRLDFEMVRPGPAGLVSGPDSRPWTAPADAGGWREWDGVVCAGWSGLEGVVDWSTLAAATSGGLGLLVLASGEDFPPPPALREALPVVSADVAAVAPGGWRMAVPRVASRHPLLEEVSIPVYGSGDAGRLSPLASVMKVRPAAGAETILVAGRARASAAEAEPLLVAGGIGGARTAWFGGQPLWQPVFWRPPATDGNDAPHPVARLVRNLLVWTAEGEALAGISLAGHRNVYAEGERIHLEARRRGLFGVGGEAPGVLEVRAAGDTSAVVARTFRMTPVPERPGCSEVVLPPLPPGAYTAVARPAAGDGGGRPQTFVITSHSQEEIQVRQDSRGLRDLASSLGGSYLAGDRPAAADGVASFVAGLDLRPATAVSRGRTPLWSGWGMLLLTAALLTAEWILRRRLGML